jgi:hypothetical protein
LLSCWTMLYSCSSLCSKFKIAYLLTLRSLVEKAIMLEL